MKKLLLLVLLFAAASAAFAHEPGEMLLNIEVPVGLVIPQIELDLPADFATTGTELSLGFDAGGRVTFNFYFLSMLSANVGLGFGGFTDVFFVDYYSRSTSGYKFSGIYTYDTFYMVIPFGVRFNARAFLLGAGLNAWIPLTSKFEGTGSWDSSSAQESTVKDDSFKIDPFLGAYVDIGFDLAGRDDRTHGFGMVFRIANAFPENIVSDSKIKYDTFRHTTLSIVFNYSFRVAKVSLGGK